MTFICWSFATPVSLVVFLVYRTAETPCRIGAMQISFAGHLLRGALLHAKTAKKRVKRRFAS